MKHIYIPLIVVILLNSCKYRVDKENEKLTGNYEPKSALTWKVFKDNDVKVGTLAQETSRGIYTRRYLYYLPKEFDISKEYPLVVSMGGSQNNAEISKHFDTWNDYDRLADQHQFVVVYPNPLSEPPKSYHDPFWAHSGDWMSIKGDEKEGLELDLEFLIMIDQDLQSKGVNIKKGARFLSGYNEGAVLSLEAAKQMYPRYRAVFAGLPEPVMMKNTNLNLSLMFYYTSLEKRKVSHSFIEKLDFTYEEQIEKNMADWGSAISVVGDTLKKSNYEKLSNTIIEGQDYTGFISLALNTKNSKLFKKTLFSKDSSNQLVVYKSNHGGYAIPHPRALGTYTNENITGFRNQDMNSIEVAWDFFSQFIE